MTAREEQAGFERGRARLDRVRAEQERARRGDVDRKTPEEIDADQPDIAPEHNSVTVANEPFDKPAESDAR